MRLIDADELLKENFTETFVNPLDQPVFEWIIEQTPTIDAAPVVHGKWVDHMVRDWRCSLCGKKLLVRGCDGYMIKNLPNFCPNCGARMDGE